MSDSQIPAADLPGAGAPALTDTVLTVQGRSLVRAALSDVLALAPPPAPYVLPPATAGALGGMKPGTGLEVAPDGTVSLSAGEGGSGTLAGDADVSILAPADGDGLVYDAVSARWRNFRVGQWQTVYPGTIDPAHSSPGIVVTGGGRTVTTTESSYHTGVGSRGRSGGKCYFEITLDAVGGSNALSPGVVNRGAGLGNVVGNDADGAGFSFYDSVLRFANAGANIGRNMVAGDAVGVAVDMDGHDMWLLLRAQGTTPTYWWNGVSTATPEASAGAPGGSGGMASGGVPGIDVAALRSFLAGTLYPAVAVYNGSQATLNTTGPFAHPVPAGFVPWDDAAAPPRVFAATVGGAPGTAGAAPNFVASHFLQVTTGDGTVLYVPAALAPW